MNNKTQEKDKTDTKDQHNELSVLDDSYQDTNISRPKLARASFLIVFSLMLLLNWALFQPMIHPIIFGAILAGTFAPIFNKILVFTQWKREICSVLTCLIICFVVILPLAYIILQLSKESLTAYRVIRDGLSREAIHNLLFGQGQIAQFISSTAELFNVEFTPREFESFLLETIRSFSGYILNTINQWLGNVIMIVFHFIIMILVIYGLFVDGPTLKRFFFNLSPLPNDQEQLILHKFNQMNYVTLICNGIGGVLQGGLATIGFYFAGIQSLFLWFSLMVILAFIPLVGISFITVPACIYLFVTGEKTTAIILLIYTASVSLVVENWFKPLFIGKRIRVNSLLVLMYIIGGMAVFGMAGIFYGPLICILFLTIVEIYHDYYAKEFEIDESQET